MPQVLLLQAWVSQMWKCVPALYNWAIISIQAVLSWMDVRSWELIRIWHPLRRLLVEYAWDTNSKFKVWVCVCVGFMALEGPFGIFMLTFQGGCDYEGRVVRQNTGLTVQSLTQHVEVCLGKTLHSQRQSLLHLAGQHAPISECVRWKADCKVLWIKVPWKCTFSLLLICFNSAMGLTSRSQYVFWMAFWLNALNKGCGQHMFYIHTFTIHQYTRHAWTLNETSKVIRDVKYHQTEHWDSSTRKSLFIGGLQ